MVRRLLVWGVVVDDHSACSWPLSQNQGAVRLLEARVGLRNFAKYGIFAENVLQEMARVAPRLLKTSLLELAGQQPQVYDDIIIAQASRHYFITYSASGSPPQSTWPSIHLPM